MLCKLMPELDYLAAIISSNEPLSFDKKVIVVNNLYTQCLHDFSMVYCPEEGPIKGLCPVTSCHGSLEMQA